MKNVSCRELTSQWCPWCEVSKIRQAEDDFDEALPQQFSCIKEVATPGKEIAPNQDAKNVRRQNL